ncbi:unnamed protein product [Miscanthus lutarioriparius]|uniref:MAGE domain-containing protein n=1 Tax=Miscanthus lutarioriparius TaxID=422564 RepID=A0A811PUH8_9POAL|nr:unnamed protein product [Miscanthus lutarioriparius]
MANSDELAQIDISKEVRTSFRVDPHALRNACPQVNVEAKSYVLVSNLDPEVYSKYVEDKGAAHLSGFAFAVICTIHLAGGKMPEAPWHQLKRVGGVNENDETHPVLGNKKLEHLVQQRYLLKEKVVGPEGHFMMYELVERALDESISAKIKDHISQVVGASLQK